MSRLIISPLIKAQVEKLTIANGGKPLTYSSSSPSVVLPKKSTQTNASPPSSLSYISVADQMSSVEEFFTQSNEERDDGYTSLPMLASTCQQLEHSAARDRIAVKNKRRQAMKEKLITVDETENDEKNLIEDDVIPKIEVKNEIQQPIVDLKDLDIVRSRLRSRERSTDKHVSTLNITTNIQRSVSLKRSHDVHPTESNEKHDEVKEHIYDNVDICKHQLNATNNVKAREHSARLRPVTMYMPTNSSELENVFNQLKNKSLNKRNLSKERNEEEIPSVIIEESVQPSMSNEQTTDDLVVKQETKTSANKIVETPNRRRTVGGFNLTGNQQAKPSWIDLIKEKQSKIQSESIEEKVEPMVIVRKELTISSSTMLIKENTPEDAQTNGKTIYEPVLPRLSPSSTAHIIERDSIRALKAANPNRINNLIQLFDKA